MTRVIMTSLCLWCLLSCDIHTNGGKNNTRLDKMLQIKLRPVDRSSYDYDIINESKTNLEVNDKKVENINRSEAEVIYTIAKEILAKSCCCAQYPLYAEYSYYIFH